MSKFAQEFFWTPTELLTWLRRVREELGLWLVVWRVGKSAELVELDSIQPSMFCGGQEDSVQLFLGTASLSPAPQWRVTADRRELDFQRSYAVQLVPSMLSTDGRMLLQGRLAIMRPTDYEDQKRAAELAKLFRRLTAELKRDSDAGRVIVQPLPTGERKRWGDVLVGRQISESNLKLKQFSRGEVEFQVEPV
ncbi:MAG: hypothetical protein WBO04_03835 [Steroidobacteraceae bacterium]